MKEFDIQKAIDQARQILEAQDIPKDEKELGYTLTIQALNTLLTNAHNSNFTLQKKLANSTKELETLDKEHRSLTEKYKEVAVKLKNAEQQLEELTLSRAHRIKELNYFKERCSLLEKEKTQLEEELRKPQKFIVNV